MGIQINKFRREDALLVGISLQENTNIDVNGRLNKAKGVCVCVWGGGLKQDLPGSKNQKIK